MTKIALIITMLIVTISFANQNANGQGQREMREPPQEAISACEGDECSMSTPRGDTLEGSCKNTPDNKYFVCMPANHKR